MDFKELREGYQIEFVKKIASKQIERGILIRSLTVCIVRTMIVLSIDNIRGNKNNLLINRINQS